MQRRWWAFLTALVLGIGLSPALPAQATVKATLSLAAHPEPVLGHEVVTVLGHLTPVRVGRAVKLQRRAGSHWVTLGTAHTNAASNYSLRTRAPLRGTEVLRAVVLAAGGAQVVSAALTLAPVSPSISIGGDTWVLTGGVLHTNGAFSPARPGRLVSLQRKSSARWITMASARLSATSRYALSGLIRQAAGSVSVRIVAAPFNGAPAQASAVHVITVADLPPTLQGPFDAVYIGLKAGSTQGSYGQVPGSPALVFTDDGTVTSAVPAAGPGDPALPASARSGVYFAHDGVVDIVWQTDGTSVTLRAQRNGQLIWNGRSYGIVDALQDAHLSGSYKRVSGGSGATITFTSAGRFHRPGHHRRHQRHDHGQPVGRRQLLDPGQHRLAGLRLGPG